MFVCHGNICRSPMAEFVMKDELKKRNLDKWIKVYSSATSYEETGNPVYPPAVAKMKSSDKHSPLMANVEKNRTEKTLKRMAIPLKDLSMVTTSEPVFIINNDKIAGRSEIPRYESRK